jgi:hypothetical protein
MSRMVKLMLLSRAALLACALLALPGLALSGCAIRDRMTGEAEARRIREVGVAAPATVVQIWDTGVTVNDDPVVGFCSTSNRKGRRRSRRRPRRSSRASRFRASNPALS